MPTFDIAFYVRDERERTEEFDIEAKNMAEALVAASNLLSRVQGNALIVETIVEEREDVRSQTDNAS